MEIKVQEPAVSGSPTPKKRGRKTSKKQYFTQETQDSIQIYLDAKTQRERDTIFEECLYYPFYKLAENLIHTFKFYYTEVDNLEDLKHEVIIVLLEKLQQGYYKPSKGKAFSYFSIIGKNWLILYNNSNYKKKKQSADLKDVDEDPIILKSLDREEIKKDKVDFVELMIKYIDKHMFRIFKKSTDQKVADAVMLLFKRRENLEIFNKKALYIYIREITNVDTPQITKVVKVLKKHYKKLYNEFETTGNIRV